MRFVLSSRRRGASGLIAAGAVLLGGFRMPAAIEDAGPGDDRVRQALASLQQALQIVDSLEDCHVIGARLQEVIELLEERLGEEPGSPGS